MGVQYTPDTGVLALAAANPGSPVQYQFDVKVYDVERFTLSSDNHNLLSDTTYTGTSDTLTLGGWGEDREVVILGRVLVVGGGGQVLADRSTRR